MNEDLLRTCPAEVQEAHWQQRDVIGALERSLLLAIAAYVSGSPPAELPGDAPALDSDAIEWVDYFVARGSLVFHQDSSLVGVDG